MKKRKSRSKTEERGQPLLYLLAIVVVLLFIVVLFLETPTGQAFLQRIYG
ncbi:hypothetical protein HY495_03330 [Candidatus Woesearchaeota archaeon]|nr:hypothetical protein [Candidatus Woesearchaeota archaeon]